jgi:hypothetical protein
MDNENIEKIWTEMRQHFEWMKVTLESLSDEEREVLEAKTNEWFFANPLERNE